MTAEVLQSGQRNNPRERILAVGEETQSFSEEVRGLLKGADVEIVCVPDCEEARRLVGNGEIFTGYVSGPETSRELSKLIQPSAA